MAANFQISMDRKKTRIVISPAGTLDGSSACELAQALQAQAGKKVVVHLDTDRLRHVSPFGASVLSSRLDKMRSGFRDLTVTGAHAEALAG